MAAEEKKYTKSNKNKAGFTSVWLVMILSSLMFLLLVITEAASGFVCGSICENACVSAGQSVLSEFDTALYENYGVLALRSNDTKIADMASYYIGSSIAAEGCLVNPKLKKCTVLTESYPGLGTELFEAQIKALGVQSGIYSLAGENSLIQAFSGLLEASEYADTLDSSSINGLQTMMNDCSDEADDLLDEASDLKDALSEMKASEDYDEEAARAVSDDIKKLENKADKAQKEADLCGNLIRKYNSAVDPDFGSDEEGCCISEELAAELPSGMLEIPATLSLLLSGGITEPDPDAIPCGEYILNNCSNCQNRHENTFLKAEAEYILYGHNGEADNISALKRSLFSIRFPLNLKSVYADPQKMAEYHASAAAFLPVPVSLTVFVLASIDASAQSLNDIELICSGHKVPFVKGGNGGDYSDYLRILLLCLPQDIKMVRLMDIMQMNLSEKQGKAFAFRDYCYGFSLSAEFEKNLKVSVIDVPSIRTGKISIQLQYK